MVFDKNPNKGPYISSSEKSSLNVFPYTIKKSKY